MIFSKNQVLKVVINIQNKEEKITDGLNSYNSLMRTKILV